MSFLNKFKKNFSSLGGVAGFVANPIGSLTSSVGSALASGVGNGNIEDQWDLFKNGKTNQVNMELNKQNIDYQKEYNQQIWNREDTSYQRTLKDMASVGMSPLAMSGLNGAGGSSNSPNNMFGWSDKGAGQAFAEVANFASQLASISNLTAQTKLVNAQADEKDLLNGLLKNKIDYFNANGFVDGMNDVAQNKLFNAQVYEKNLTNGLLKNKSNYFKSNGFVDGMNDYEKALMLGIGVLGDGNPVFSSDKDGLSFNNIANALRQGIKSGSVQKSVQGLLSDVLSAESGRANFNLGASLVGSGFNFARGMGSAFIDKGIEGVKDVKEIGKKISNSEIGKKFFKKIFSKNKDTKKPGDKGFSKQQSDARKARSGK